LGYTWRKPNYFSALSRAILSSILGCEANRCKKACRFEILNAWKDVCCARGSSIFSSDFSPTKASIIGQMAPNSPCLIALEFGVGEDEKTEYCHVASTADNIIRPMSSAKGPQRNENITLNATGHVGYMFSSRVANLIIKKLQQLADHTQPV